jgi:hypothetical protein
MAHPDPEPSDPRRDSVNQAPAPESEAQPASDGAAPIDDSPVPPLTDSADTKGG